MAIMDELKEVRLCHLVKWSDFNGYGFNLHAEKGKTGHFIGKVDENSPAETANMKPGDRIVEVDGVNIGNENHKQVVKRIQAGGNETRLLVLSQDEEDYFKEKKVVVTGDLPNVKLYKTPPTRPDPASEAPPVNGEVPKDTEPEVAAATAAVAAVEVSEVASEKLPDPPAPTEPEEPPVVEDTSPPEPPSEQTEQPAAQEEVVVTPAETSVEQPPDAEVATKEDEDDHVYEQADLPPPEPQPTVIQVPPPDPEPEPEPPKEPEPEPEPEPPKEPEPVPEPEPLKEPEPEPPKEPEPEPAKEVKAPEPAPVPAQTGGSDGGLNLPMSAKEMRERLTQKKKVDPRTKGGSFQHKYEVFQRM